MTKNITLALLTGLLVDAPLLTTAETPSNSTVAVGFRGDGSGIFASAAMPALDLKNGKGVAWRSELPAAGNSSPVILGQAVIVTADPDLVIAYNQADGKELWKKSIGVVDGLTPEQDQQLRPLLLKYVATPVNQRKAVSGEIGTLVGPAKSRSWGPGEFGWSLPTPVSDGKRVYVVFYTGMVAAFDATGNTIWSNYLPKLRVDASPILADGVLVISGRDGIRGLDPATGKVRYEAPAATRATPAVWRKNGASYLIHANGLVVAAADGKVLAPAPDWHQITDASPVLAGDRVIITFGHDHGAGDQQVAAYDLALADGKITLTEAWRGTALLPNSTPEKPVKRWFSRISPLVVGELLITPVPGNALFVHRLKDGKLLDPVPGVAIDGQPHTFWPNPILVGQTVVIPEAWGKLTLLKLGGTSFQVQSVEAVLTHEGRRPSGPRMGASPLAWGSTLFLRTDKELIALR